MKAGTRHKIRVEWDPNEGYIACCTTIPIPAADQRSLTMTSDVAHAVDYYFVAAATWTRWSAAIAA
jgi:alpha-D-xyloside xylohydrolase